MKKTGFGAEELRTQRNEIQRKLYKDFSKLLANLLPLYDLNLVIESGKKNFMLSSSSDDIQLRGEFEITRAPKLMIEKRVSVCPVRVE